MSILDCGTEEGWKGIIFVKRDAEKVVCTFNWIPRTCNEVDHDACKLYLVPPMNIIVLYLCTPSLKVDFLID